MQSGNQMHELILNSVDTSKHDTSHSTPIHSDHDQIH